MNQMCVYCQYTVFDALSHNINLKIYATQNVRSTRYNVRTYDTMIATSATFFESFHYLSSLKHHRRIHITHISYGRNSRKQM